MRRTSWPDAARDGDRAAIPHSGRQRWRIVYGIPILVGKCLVIRTCAHRPYVRVAWPKHSAVHVWVVDACLAQQAVIRKCASEPAAFSDRLLGCDVRKRYAPRALSPSETIGIAVGLARIKHGDHECTRISPASRVCGAQPIVLLVDCDSGTAAESVRRLSSLAERVARRTEGKQLVNVPLVGHVLHARVDGEANCELISRTVHCVHVVRVRGRCRLDHHTPEHRRARTRAWTAELTVTRTRATGGERGGSLQAACRTGMLRWNMACAKAHA